MLGRHVTLCAPQRHHWALLWSRVASLVECSNQSEILQLHCGSDPTTLSPDDPDLDSEEPTHIVISLLLVRQMFGPFDF